MKYYVDTSIWRDYYEDRKDNLKPLGEFAFEFFRKVKINNDKILYSDLVIEELNKAYNEKEIKQIFNIIEEENLLEKVEISKNQLKEALDLKRKLQIPFGDALHAILAKDNDAILITRDEHFQKLDFINVKKPEDLI